MELSDETKLVCEKVDPSVGEGGSQNPPFVDVSELRHIKSRPMTTSCEETITRGTEYSEIIYL